MQPYYEQDGITIYHGDCRQVLQAEPSHVVISDPPYGISFDPRDGRFLGDKVANDHSTEARDWLVSAYGVSHPMALTGSPDAPRPDGYRIVLVWDKGDHVGMGDLSLPWKKTWEEIYIFGKGWKGRRTGAVLRHLAIAGCVGTRTWRHHPTEKPESLFLELIRKAPRGVIVDPFMGSGTTLVAAKRLGRSAVGIELEEKYCEIAAKRLAQGALPMKFTA
jgi:DNA modification methylase